jgi:hypothetical protein
LAASRRGSGDRKARRPPATTLKGREDQLIAAAYDLVESKIADGTATSQELTHFLKLGATREVLEQERLRQENKLLEAKVEALASQKRVEELYENALQAMRTYSGYSDGDSPYADQDLH